MRWASVEDPIRLKAMSDVMNKALDQVQETDDIVVWIMSDLEWKADSILALIKAVEGTDKIAAPLALMCKEGPFYDTWAYRKDGERFQTRYPFHGAWDRCCSVGRQVIEDSIDSAGTCLVMPARAARDCRASNLEAVSFCENAHAEGFGIVIRFDSEVVHAPLPRKRLLWISDAICTSGFARVAHAMFPLLAEAGYDLDLIAINYFGEPHNFPYRIYPANVQGEDISGDLRVKYLVYGAQMEGRPYDLIIKLDDPWNIKGLTNSLKQLEEGFEIPSPPVLAWITVDGKNVNGSELDSLEQIACSSEFGASEIVRHRYESTNAMVSPNVSVVPFGVDTSIFKPLDKDESRSLVSSAEIPLDAFIVGTVSTNQLRKRLDLVLDYFAAWINQYSVNNAYLYLCLGPEFNSGCDIQSLVKYYGLQSRVILNTSLLNDQALAHVYSSFDVYLSLSQGEGFGLTALEAMACGVPCVVSDWAAYSSWVPEEVAYKISCLSTAMSGPLNTKSYVIGGVADRDETVGALQKLYMYPDLREKMGKAGVKFASKMTWRETGRRLLEEIDQVIKRSAPTPSSMMSQAETEGIR
jgi:glycosyltransferase involved in cell wall biosynthesis